MEVESSSLLNTFRIFKCEKYRGVVAFFVCCAPQIQYVVMFLIWLCALMYVW